MTDSPFPFAKTMIYREVVASTSDLARDWILREHVEEDFALPLLVWASRQTAGRGRGENRWWSDEGSLTFTLALDPAEHGLRPEHEPRVALTAAVAIIDAVSPYLAERPGIRWPNDVELLGRKLGGILPEKVKTSRGTRLLIGIGLNVRTRFGEAPQAIREMATSIESNLKPSIVTPDHQELLGTILDRLVPALDRLASNDPSLVEQWTQHDQLLGKSVRIRLAEEIISGIAVGIDPRGGLIVADTDWKTSTLYAGQVLRDREHS